VRLVAASFAGALLLPLAILVIGARAASSPAVLCALALVGAVAGGLVLDQLVGRAVAARGRRLTAAFPAVAELLAFSVAAGESTTGALSRVVSSTGGELSDELALTLADMRGGAPMTTALRALGDRAQAPVLDRFVDGVVVAVERGTPLAEVLRAQAADARAHGQRELIESAGRREVFMLMPVVFLILPTVVLVALFPGLAALSMSVP